MPAPKGNSFWLARTKQSRDKLFSSPDVLWKAACEYFEWVEENPLWEHKVSLYLGKPVPMKIDKMRAMTITAFCLFLGVDSKTYQNYRGREGYEDFFPIMAQIDDIIRDQKFSGAAADLFNANIIARDLGLKDRSDVSSEDGSMTPKDSSLTKEQAIELLKKNGMQADD